MVQRRNTLKLIYANVSYNKRKKFLVSQLNKLYRMPTLPECCLLVGLYQLNGNTAAAVMRQFRRGLISERVSERQDLGIREKKLVCRKEEEKGSALLSQRILQQFS